MPHYLTNTSLHHEELTKLAAERSGQPVTFEREPMPAKAHESSHYANHRKNMIGTDGCVVGHRIDCRDYSSFWRAWNAIAKEQPHLYKSSFN